MDILGEYIRKDFVLSRNKMALDFRVSFGYPLMVETEIKEKICLVSLFENGQIKPIAFLWKKRVHKILRIVFSYSKDIGKEKVFYFSVECGGGMFELSFNRDKFSWEIEKAFL